ncbi:hypothetical protein PPERSA_05223 [Pseudocohnilembus persalinus]|uniref:Uncharacterized protein n=1 Tax=Pseudocohnilembus persalinus TaxID=266149 RepID=A0A0V0R9Z7_PSEPJ|nr:hypothetical protein PPERSA_05223 [Pseudocohnilembus persalinus]|eukprot:KRX11114.1 hypothetical protein PPERSA_05223 [Pseudocohnilembus persalinus]
MQQDQQQQNQEISRIGIQFGEDFQEDNNLFFKALVQINQDAANQQLNQLETDIDNQWQIPYNFIISIKITEQNLEKCQELLENLKNKNTSYHESFLYQILLKKGEINIDHKSIGEKIYIALIPNEQLQQDIKGNIEPFLDLGLLDLASQQNNQIEVNIQTKYSGNEILENIKKGERASSVLLHNFKFETLVTLNQNLHTKLKEIVSQVDPSFVQSPPFLFLRYFKNLDVDMRFNTTAELPESIKNKLLFGEILTVNEENKVDFSNDDKILPFLESLDQNIELFFTVPDLLKIHLQGHSLALSQYIQTYGKYFENL